MLDCENKKVDTKEENAVFDLTAQYEEKIIPLAKKLMAACDEIKLPYLLHFICANDSGKTTGGVLASVHGKKCVATDRLMAAAHMCDGESNILPVPVDPSNLSSLLALTALAASLKKD